MVTTPFPTREGLGKGLLFLIVFIVKLFLYHLSLEDLFADLDGERCVEFCELGLDEGHADALIDAEAVVAGCDFAHDFAICVKNGITVTGDSLVSKFNTDELLRYAVGFLLHEGFLADEFGLVELAEHREASHYWRDICAEFVAIQWQTYFEAERVAAA